MASSSTSDSSSPPMDLKLIALPITASEKDVKLLLAHTFSKHAGQSPDTPFRPAENWPDKGIRCSVVGPTHIAFLFEDGTVGRIKYKLDKDAVHATMESCKAATTCKTTEKRQNMGEGAANAAGSSRAMHRAYMGVGRRCDASSSMTSHGVSAERYTPSVPTRDALGHRYSLSAGGSDARSARRGSGRGSAHTQGRGSASLAGSSSHRELHARHEHVLRMMQRRQRQASGPALPASAVPEELVTRMLEILPGKARSTVVRQLQRAHLDVDAAINALLASDDNDDDDEDGLDDDAHIADDQDASSDMLLGRGGSALDDSRRHHAMHLMDIDMEDHDHHRAHGSSELHPDPLEPRWHHHSLSPHPHHPGSLGSPSMVRASLFGEQSEHVDEDLASMQSHHAALFEHTPLGLGSRKRRPSSLRSSTDDAKRALEEDASRVSSSTSDGDPAVPPSNGVTTTWGAVAFDGALEMCSTGLTFTAIASMRSTLLLVETSSQVLWEAPWHASLDAACAYGRAAVVGLEGVPVQRLFASMFRTIVLTQEGHLVTVVDECCAIPCDVDGDGTRNAAVTDTSVASTAPQRTDVEQTADMMGDVSDVVPVRTRSAPPCPSSLRFLEHAQRMVPADYDMDQVVHVDVTSTMTCAYTVSGKLFWWGYLPLPLRQELVAKNAKRRKAHMGSPNIRVGDVVQLKAAPLYRPGAIGFNPSASTSHTCVGKLLDTVWDLTDRCRFQSLHHHASCSNGANEPVPVEDVAIVDWSLDNVVFLQQGNTEQSATVLKVDGPHVAVYFESETPPDVDTPVDDAFRWAHSRLFRTDELCHYKPPVGATDRSMTTAPVAQSHNGGNTGDASGAIDVIPDFLQRTPALIDLGAASVSGAVITAKGFRVWATMESHYGDSNDHMSQGLGLGACRNATHVQQHLVLEWDKSGVLRAKDSSSFLPGVTRQMRPRFVRGGCGPAGAFLTMVDDTTKTLCSLVGTSNVQHRYMGRMRILNVPAIHAVHSGVARRVERLAIKEDCEGSPAAAVDSPSPVELVAVLTQRLSLFPVVFADDRAKLQAFVASLTADTAMCAANECVDGSSNILHALVARAFMKYCTQVDAEKGRGGTEAETSARRKPVPPAPSRLSTHALVDSIKACRALAGPGDRTRDKREPNLPPLEHCEYELFCLEVLLADDSPLSPYRAQLLCHTDDCGQTPLMSALVTQQYSLANTLLDAIGTSMMTQAPEQAHRLLCGGDGVTGQTPLHAAVADDLCTYNRTGDVHVEQDVFECRTCNIVDELCVCVACATVGHVGHDVRYKGRAPSAYCDSHDTDALELLPSLWQHRDRIVQQLLRWGSADSADRSSKNVLTATNFDGETVLYSLVAQHANGATVEAGGKTKPPNAKALHQEKQLRGRVMGALAQSWDAVVATLLIGATDLTALAGSDVVPQHDCAQLDHFTHNLLVLVDKWVLEYIVRTAQSALAKSVGGARPKEVHDHRLAVVARFVRSVVRVCCVYSSGDMPADDAELLAAARQPASSLPSSSAAAPRMPGGRTTTNDPKHLDRFLPEGLVFDRVRYVLNAFPAIAVQELADNTDALLAPVVAGLVRPQAPFLATTATPAAPTGSDSVQYRLLQARVEARAAARASARTHLPNSSTGDAPSGDAPNEATADRYKYAPTCDPSAIFSLFAGGMPPAACVRRQWALARAWVPEDIHTGSSVTALIPTVAPGTASQPTAVTGTDVNQAGTTDGDTVVAVAAEASSAWALRQHMMGSAVNETSAPGAGRSAPPERHARFSYRAPERTPGGSGENVIETEAQGKAYVCRMYGRMVKLMIDTARVAWSARGQSMSTPPPHQGAAGVSDARPTALRHATDVMIMQLERGWAWLVSTLDAIEAQLRRGDRVLQMDPHVLRARLLGDTATVPPEDQATKPSTTRVPPDAERRRSAMYGSRAPELRPDGSALSDGSGMLGHGDFRKYALSLLRAHSNEHGDTVPVLDVSQTEYLAYLLDAFMYFLQFKAETAPQLTTPLSNVCRSSTLGGTAHTGFFMRSESVAGSGRAFPALFATPMKEALPLADRPDQLHPTSTKAMMFGTPSRTVPSTEPFKTPLYTGARPAELPSTPPAGTATTTPMRLSTSQRLTPSAETDISPLHLHRARHTPPTADTPLLPTVPDLPDMRLVNMTSGGILERWRKMIGIFVQLCIATVGAERSSFVVQAAGYRVKELRFRDRMEKLLRTLPRSSDFRRVTYPRDRMKLLLGVHASFANHLRSNLHRAHPFLCRTMKVEFENEPGEGTGVVRSFLAAVANGLLEQHNLPLQPSFQKTHEDLWKYATRIAASTPGNGVHGSTPTDPGHVNSDGSVSSTSQTTTPPPYHYHIAPLFHAPGKPGFMTPVLWCKDVAANASTIEEESRDGGMVVDDTPDSTPDATSSNGEQAVLDYRLSWFENVGLLVGISIAHGNILPIRFSRHVLKYLLGRPIAWHDLAFFDPLMYESLRKTIVAATAEGAGAASAFADWGLTFHVDKPAWLGGGSHHLVPHGDAVAVNADNVHDYVALYAKYLMVDSVKPALDAMRQGLQYVLPDVAFDGLSAEDLRLVLNGTSDVDVGLLQKMTVFKNETGKDEYFVEQTRKWFWSIVKDMRPSQRHDLVYFWTSSAGLPATEAGFVPKPLIVVRPPSEGNAGMLPTANTCSARLSMPVYPSIKVMRRKLLAAIDTKTFGFV